MIARFHASYTFTNFDDDACAFMAQNDREEAFGIVTREGECIGMANASVGDLDQHLALARRLDVNFDYFQRFSWPEGYSCT